MSHRTSPPGTHFGLAAVALVAAFGLTACDRTDPDHRMEGTAGGVTEAEAAAGAEPVVRNGFREALELGSAELTFFYVPSSGFAYRDEGGRLTGLTVELLRDFAHYAADEHGLELRVEWVEEELWADFYGYVRDSRGGAFGVGNVTITDTRREELDFSPPYLENVAVLVTHEEVDELATMDDIGDAFRGLTALPYPGTLHETRLEALAERHLPEVSTRPVASNDELVSLLASGDGYFGYIDVYNYWRAREAGQPLRRHAVGDDASEAFGVILPHDSDWTPVIESFFLVDGGYVHSPRYSRLMQKHLGEELARLLSSPPLPLPSSGGSPCEPSNAGR